MIDRRSEKVIKWGEDKMSDWEKTEIVCSLENWD